MAFWFLFIQPSGFGLPTLPIFSWFTWHDWWMTSHNYGIFLTQSQKVPKIDECIFFTLPFLYIAYMQFLKMHLLHTSFPIAVILTSCNSHFLICLSVYPKNYLSCLSLPLATFLKTKAQLFDKMSTAWNSIWIFKFILRSNSWNP